MIKEIAGRDTRARAREIRSRHPALIAKTMAGKTTHCAEHLPSVRKTPAPEAALLGGGGEFIELPFLYHGATGERLSQYLKRRFPHGFLREHLGERGFFVGAKARFGI